MKLTSSEWSRISSAIRSDAIVIPDLYHKIYYWWGITWSESFHPATPHRIKSEDKQALPEISRFALDCIRSLVILRGIPLNPPPFVDDPDRMSRIQFPHNQLVILEALYRSGGEAQYDNDKKDQMLYSEHSGALDIRRDKIAQVLVFATPGRVDTSDATIIMPANVSEMKQYPYLFHTHPNTTGDHMARYREGVPYELPSPGDLHHFSHYASRGTCQGSVIVSPEGMYVMRKANWCIPVDMAGLTQKNLAGIVGSIQKEEMVRLKKIESKLVDLDAFHRYVSGDPRAINKLNVVLNDANIFVDYYPRIRRGSTWALPEIKLNYQEPKWLEMIDEDRSEN